MNYDNKKQKKAILNKEEYPSVICNECASVYKLKLKSLYATFYEVECDVCKQIGICTELRDYGYPELNKCN